MTVQLPADHVFAGLQERHYRCILIDPPTQFVAGTKGRPQHYKRMTDADIAALPVGDLLHPEGAWIFLWVTSPKFYAPPGSRTQLSPDEMVRGWGGARYSGRAFVWIKTKRSRGQQFFIHADDDLHMGQGYTTRKNAEDCLIFKVGRPARCARDVREPILAPAREHSRKPDEAIDRIERLCLGPRVELFARDPFRSGWDLWGNEVGKFALSSPRPLLLKSGTLSSLNAPAAAYQDANRPKLSKSQADMNLRAGSETG